MDLSCKRLTTLINDYQLRGEYSIRFASNGLESGVYSLVFQNGQLVQTKWMVINRSGN